MKLNTFFCLDECVDVVKCPGQMKLSIKTWASRFELPSNIRTMYHSFMGLEKGIDFNFKWRIKGKQGGNNQLQLDEL